MTRRPGFARGPARLSVALALVLATTSGCELLGVRGQQELEQQTIRFAGRVRTTEALRGRLVVVLIKRSDEEGVEDQLLDHYVIERSGGRFRFISTEPGRYALAAFNDRDSDLRYERDEPVFVANSMTTFDVDLGDKIDGLDIVVDPQQRAEPGEPIDILEFQSRSMNDQLAISIGQLQSAGEVTKLSDPRFAAEVGPKGLWSPYDFIFDIGAGIFFLEPYDPDRIPVLFIHGISGFPAQFADLIDSLDHKRFQAWVYLYPSGAKLRDIATHLTQMVVQIESRYDVAPMAYVAHSMGGLVTRAALLDYYQQTGRDLKREMITISTPWDGIASAGLGTRNLSHPVYSWIDVAPESDFLNEIFYLDPVAKTRRLLPSRLSRHILFGFGGRSSISIPILKGLVPKELRNERASDGTVSVASQLRPAAQLDAQSVFGVDATHTGILKNERTLDRVNSLLGHYADEL